MKAAFNILPVKNENEPLHLLVEAGCYGISFIWFTKSPGDIKGLAVYNFVNSVSPSEIAEEINNVLRSHPVFSEPNASVTICYDFKESLLVPGEYHKQQTDKAMLGLVYDSDNNSDIKTDTVRDINIFNAYAVDKKIAAVLSGKFPAAAIYHSTSLHLEKIRPSGHQLYCIIFHNSLKVFLFKEGALQLVQQFTCSKPVDVTYHLLNCCGQYDMNATDVSLQLSGMIDAHSILYNELYKYFLNISFQQQDAAIIVHDKIKFYPEHFFSHLTALVSCVS